MKKTLIAAAALAFVGAASAQVTLSGVYGIGLTNTDGSQLGANTNGSRLQRTDSSVTFAASEDLGGGMKVAVSQTLAIGTHAGAATGDGGSLTLSGGFGSLKVANSCAGAALGEAVVGGAYNFAYALNAGATDCRADYQTALYTLPEFVKGLGLAVRTQNLATGTDIAADKFSYDDNRAQVRINYSVGSLNAAFYARSKTSELHAAYDFGMFAVKFATDTKTSNGMNKRTEFGVTAPMGPVTLAFGYGKQADTNVKGAQFGLTYALSKRTAVDAQYGKFDEAVNKGVTSTRVRLLHSF